ncbi:MAG: hypothetical protein EOP73_24820 [Variovorax sp.]|nr:MAG: hypothetical protein EOP73_24820 [Variovorax sp.]
MRQGYDSPPGCAHCVSLRQPPCRGRHPRTGAAGSALSWVGAVTSCMGVTKHRKSHGIES